MNDRTYFWLLGAVVVGLLILGSVLEASGH